VGKTDVKKRDRGRDGHPQRNMKCILSTIDIVELIFSCVKPHDAIV